MKRTSLLVALMVVHGTLVVPAASVVAQEDSTTDDEVAPGERLSGVVSVQEAEVEGEIQTRAYEMELESAENDSERAERAAERTEELEDRLEELRERREELREQREAGELDEGEYRARVATLETEVDTVETQLNETNETVSELPEETLEAEGVNATAIDALSRQADELSGAEVSAIARSIAGNETGEVSIEIEIQRTDGVTEIEIEREDGERKVEVEFEGDADNASEAVELAETRVEFAEERLDATEERLGDNASGDSVEALEPDVITLGHDQSFDPDDLEADLTEAGFAGIDVVRIGRGPTDSVSSSSDVKARLEAAVGEAAFHSVVWEDG